MNNETARKLDIMLNYYDAFPTGKRVEVLAAKPGYKNCQMINGDSIL